MSLRVAFDLDGTLADMFGAMQIEAEKLFGNVSARSDGAPGVPTNPLASGLTSQQRAQLWRRVAKIPDFWITLTEMEPGIVARLAAVAAERRWEVIFLTTRPAVVGATTQRQSQQWLEANGFRLPSVYVVQRSRGRIADVLELDAVVDDRPENCLDVALESKAQAILVRPGSEKGTLPGASALGVRIVGSVGDAITMLEKMDEARRGGGVTRRIRKLFGRE